MAERGALVLVDAATGEDRRTASGWRVIAP
jgi:hypothetical protein